MSQSPLGAAPSLPLPKKKKSCVQWGCICLLLSISMSGLSLSTIQEPILTRLNGMDYFSLLSVLSTLGLAIMTPIGGKLGDLFGRRRQVLFAAGLCALCNLGMGLLSELWAFLLLRLLLGAAQGAFTSAPYILLREINESKAVPKAMGLLASAVALGSFGGSWLAGLLADRGWLSLAILFPLLPLLLGMALIAFGLPNLPRKQGVSLDWPGITALTVALSSLLLSLNWGPRSGWLSTPVLCGFGLGLLALFLLWKAEQLAEQKGEALIPLRLFANSTYRKLLVISFLSFFYNTAMNYYAPLAVIQVLGRSAAVSGTLQLPRTLLTILLPTVCGLWVSRKEKNATVAMAVATGLVGLAFLCLSFCRSTTPLLLFYVMLALTGVAESFRAVSITPSAQQALSEQDMGIGTSLLSFANSMSNLLASAFLGILYDQSSSTAAGIRNVFLCTAVLSFVGLALVLSGQHSRRN